ncbi:MAG: glutamate-5-semialdehyde dehydrogenase [Planctomycetota bacterium]
MPTIEDAAREAREASRLLRGVSAEQKNELLLALAERLLEQKARIQEINKQDLSAADEAGISSAKRKRLVLNEEGVEQLAVGLRELAQLPDPVGQVTSEIERPNRLKVKRVRVPLGVIAMIYEARPGVTIDAFALCFKAGNACLLKGGKEASRSNELLAEIAKSVLEEHKLPSAAITAVTSGDREELKRMLTLDKHIDLIIPRGGEALIRFVHENTTIPTIQHFKGVCHAYVDAKADLDQALGIVMNGKTSAPATCNTLECALIHESVAHEFVPRLARACRDAGVEVRADERAMSIDGSFTAAGEEEWGTEYLDLVMGLRVVDSLEGAISHIDRFGSLHTEVIVTNDERAASAFLSRVDASCVLHNASPRFNDGFQLGLGAEIGISTTKLHAYGPMGLAELTTQRFVVIGDGQTR